MFQVTMTKWVDCDGDDDAARLTHALALPTTWQKTHQMDPVLVSLHQGCSLCKMCLYLYRLRCHHYKVGFVDWGIRL